MTRSEITREQDCVVDGLASIEGVVHVDRPGDSEDQDVIVSLPSGRRFRVGPDGEVTEMETVASPEVWGALERADREAVLDR